MSLLVAVVTFVAMVAVVHRQSPRTLVGDALGQAAIAQRQLTGTGTGASAGLSPENPFFAGEALPDAWLTPWIGGTLARVLGLDALHGLELVALLSAAGFALALYLLGRRLYRARTAGLVALWLALAGTFAQGPLLLVWRLRSWGPPKDDGSYLFGVVHPISRYMRVWDGWGEAGPLVAEWLGSTARPLGLAALAAVLLAVLAFLERGQAKRGLLLGLSGAFGVACAPALVAPAVISLGVILFVASFVVRSDEPHGSWRRALAAGAWLGVGAAAGAWLTWPAFARFAEAFAWHPWHEARVQLARMVESGLVLAAFAVLGVRNARGIARRFGIVVLASAAVLSLGCAALLLPERAENDLFRAALVLLAVPAAAWTLQRVKGGAAVVSPGRVLLLGLLFGAPFGVVVRAHLSRPPIAVAFEEGRLLRTPASSSTARLYEWIVTETAPEAVFIVDPAAAPSVVGAVGGMGGSTHELPAFTGRALYTERLEHPLVAGATDAQLRHWIASDAVAGRPLGVEGDAYLASFAREVYVLVREADDETLARLEALHGPPAFRAEDVAVFVVLR